MSRELNDFIIRLGGDLSDEEKTSRDTKLGPLPAKKLQTERELPLAPDATEPAPAETKAAAETPALDVEQVNEKYLNYSDVLTPEEKKRNWEDTHRDGQLFGSYLEYAQELAEILKTPAKKEQFEKLVPQLRAYFDRTIKQLGIDITKYGKSDTWISWDIAKQSYLAKHPEESSPEYDLADPLTDDAQSERLWQEIVDRHTGFESRIAKTKLLEKIDENPYADPRLTELLTESPEDGKHDISSYKLSELGRLIRENFGIGGVATEIAEQEARQGATAARRAEQKRKARIKLDPEHVLRVPKSVRRAGSGRIVREIMKKGDTGRRSRYFEDSTQAEEQNLRDKVTRAQEEFEEIGAVIETRIKPEIVQLEQDIIELNKALETKGGPANLQTIIADKLQQKKDELKTYRENLAGLKTDLKTAHQKKIAAGLELRAYQRDVATPEKIRDKIKPKLIDLAREEKEKTQELIRALTLLPEDAVAGMTKHIIGKMPAKTADILLRYEDDAPAAVKTIIATAKNELVDQAHQRIGQIPPQRVRRELTAEIEPPPKEIKITPAELRAQLIKHLREEAIDDPVLNKWIIITALDDGLISEQETATALGVLLTVTDINTRLEGYGRKVNAVAEKGAQLTTKAVDIPIRVADRLTLDLDRYTPRPIPPIVRPQLDRRARVLEWLTSGEAELEKLQDAPELAKVKKERLQLLERRQDWMLTKGRMRRETKHEDEEHAEHPHYHHSWWRHKGAVERADHLAHKTKNRVKEWWNREKGGAMGKVIDESRQCAAELPELATMADAIEQAEAFTGGKDKYAAERFNRIFDAQLPALIARVNKANKRGPIAKEKYDQSKVKLEHEQAEAQKMAQSVEQAEKEAAAAAAELTALLPPETPKPKTGIFAKLARALKNISPKARRTEAALSLTTDEATTETEQTTQARAAADSLTKLASEAKIAAIKQNTALKQAQTEFEQAQEELEAAKLELKNARAFCAEGKGEFYEHLLEESVDDVVDRSESFAAQAAMELRRIAAKKRAVARVYEGAKEKWENVAEAVKQIQNPKARAEITDDIRMSDDFQRLTEGDGEKIKLLQKMEELARAGIEINEKTLSGQPEEPELKWLPPPAPEPRGADSYDPYHEPREEQTELVPRVAARREAERQQSEQRQGETRREDEWNKIVWGSPPELEPEQQQDETQRAREFDRMFEPIPTPYAIEQEESPVNTAKRILDNSQILIDRIEEGRIILKDETERDGINDLCSLIEKLLKSNFDDQPILDRVHQKIAKCIDAIRRKIERDRAAIREAENRAEEYKQQHDTTEEPYKSELGQFYKIADHHTYEIWSSEWAIGRLSEAIAVNKETGSGQPLVVPGQELPRMPDPEPEHGQKDDLTESAQQEAAARIEIMGKMTAEKLTEKIADRYNSLLGWVRLGAENFDNLNGKSELLVFCRLIEKAKIAVPKDQLNDIYLGVKELILAIEERIGKIRIELIGLEDEMRDKYDEDMRSGMPSGTETSKAKGEQISAQMDILYEKIDGCNWAIGQLKKAITADDELDDDLGDF